MRRPILASAVATAALSLLVAACGASSPTTPTAASASAADQTPVQQQQDAFRFSACMRSHGVSSFPDPDARGFKVELAPGTAHTPAFLSAFGVCGHLMPGAGGPGPQDVHSQAQIAAFLAFARCLRAHGFPSFPDPTSTGQLSRETIAAAGINLHQPAVHEVADECVGVTHGFITRAAVARFIAGQ